MKLSVTEAPDSEAPDYSDPSSKDLSLKIWDFEQFEAVRMGKNQTKNRIECSEDGSLENVNLIFGHVDRHRISRSFRTNISFCLWISSENRFLLCKI